MLPAGTFGTGRWTPTFLAIPKTPHSSSLLAFPSVGGGQWPGSELAAWGLSGEGLRSGLEGLLPGSPVPGAAPGVLVILINRKSPPTLADRPLCVPWPGSEGPAALDLSGCFLLAGPEERERDRNGLRWGEA